MFRRVTALVMIVVVVATNVEVGFGLARDGEVHHESETLAVAHAQDRVGPIVGHGHEDLEDPDVGAHAHGPATAEASADAVSPDGPRHHGRDGAKAPVEAHDDHDQHEHGTCLDHCTHLHALALPGHAPAQAASRLISVRPFATAELPYEGSYDTLFHPPRA